MGRVLSTLLVCFMLCSNTLWANEDYWQCSAHDNQEKEWSAKSSYERVASNKAFEACKKESQVPNSCKPILESCAFSGERVDNEALLYPQHEGSGWQCTALDQNARAWVGKVHTNQDSAALDAKAYCQQHSSSPDSCYINLLTCKGH